MCDFEFGETVKVNADAREGIVLMQTGSTVTVAFHKPSDGDGADWRRFGYYTEVYEFDKVTLVQFPVG